MALMKEMNEKALWINDLVNLSQELVQRNILLLLWWFKSFFTPYFIRQINVNIFTNNTHPWRAKWIIIWKRKTGIKNRCKSINPKQIFFKDVLDILPSRYPITLLFSTCLNAYWKLESFDFTKSKAAARNVTEDVTFSKTFVNLYEKNGAISTIFTCGFGS